MTSELEEGQSRRGGQNQRTARAGEYYVAAEINRRGAYATTFTGNMPGVDVMARSADGTRTVYLQVKTRRPTKPTNTWHSAKDQGDPKKFPPREDTFWVFVDLKDNEPPEYYIVKDKEMRSNIQAAVEKDRQRYRQLHGEREGKEPTHHGIAQVRIERWKGKWESLGIWS